jgi:hypothetical protein
LHLSRLLLLTLPQSYAELNLFFLEVVGFTTRVARSSLCAEHKVKFLLESGGFGQVKSLFCCTLLYHNFFRSSFSAHEFGRLDSSFPASTDSRAWLPCPWFRPGRAYSSLGARQASTPVDFLPRALGFRSEN